MQRQGIVRNAGWQLEARTGAQQAVPAALAVNASTTSPQVRIYVALLDERTDVWQPVRTISADPKVYTIVFENTDP
jgi:hypothetical protein